MTGDLTRLIARDSAYAVFVLMMIDALEPAASELTMLYAGVLAGGAVAGAHAGLFGASLPAGPAAYVACR
jgi:hypothetical protein